MYYCGLKIGEEINTAVIIDDKAILMGNNINFRTENIEIEAFIEALNTYGIDKSNLMLCMDFDLITGYKNAYIVYKYFKDNGWNIRIKKYDVKSERVVMVIERNKVDTDTHILAKFLKYNRDKSELFMDENLNVKIKFDKSYMKINIVMNIVLFLFILYVMFYAIDVSAELNSGELLIKLFFVMVLIFFDYYVFRKFWLKCNAKLPRLVLNNNEMEILDTSYNGACKRYLEKIKLKDIIKIEKEIIYTKGNDIKKVKIITDKEHHEIIGNELNIKFKILCRLINFYWVNFSGRFQDKSQLIDYDKND